MLTIMFVEFKDRDYGVILEQKAGETFTFSPFPKLQHQKAIKRSCSSLNYAINMQCFTTLIEGLLKYRPFIGFSIRGVLVVYKESLEAL